MRTRVVFGVSEALTTLWVLAAALTAFLLWAFHQRADDLLGSVGGRNLEVATAILLLAPTAAAAWAIRADRGDLLEQTLSGARALLLSSGLLAIATALALLGFLPFGWHGAQAISWYASAAFFIAVALSVGWLVARRPTWFLYRNILTSRSANLIAICALTGATTLVALHVDQLGERWTGGLLLGLTLLLGVVAANRVAAPLGERGGVFPTLAAIGAAVSLAGAGYFLDYYAEVVEQDVAQDTIVIAEVAVTALALFALLIRVVRQAATEGVETYDGN